MSLAIATSRAADMQLMTMQWDLSRLQAISKAQFAHLLACLPFLDPASIKMLLVACGPEQASCHHSCASWRALSAQGLSLVGSGSPP